MAEFGATIEWTRSGNTPFTDNKYSRAHRWRFDGGIEVPASSSPSVVPLPLSIAEAVDPEEAFVASLSSCHMLTFLYIAARRGFIVDSYRDDAHGALAKADDGGGGQWVPKVTLRPRVRFGAGKIPTREELLAMHHAAHEQCFIARSVKTHVEIVPSE